MWNRSVAEAEGAEKAMQTKLRERPTYLGQVQKQVPRGSHHRAWSADFTLRLLRRKIQEKEKVWPKTSQDQACRSRGTVQARGEASRDELPSVPSSWASCSHPANSSTTGPPVNLGDSGPRGSTFGTQSFMSLSYHSRRQETAFSEHCTVCSWVRRGRNDGKEDTQLLSYGSYNQVRERGLAWEVSAGLHEAKCQEILILKVQVDIQTQKGED